MKTKQILKTALAKKEGISKSWQITLSLNMTS